MARRPSVRAGMPWAVVGTVLLALSACSPEKTPEQSMDAAATHLQRSETAAALIEARNALQHNPDLPRARYLLEPVLNHAIALRFAGYGRPQTLPDRCQRRRMGLRRALPDPLSA